MRDGTGGSHPHIDAPDLKSVTFANTQSTLQALLTKVIEQRRMANARLTEILAEFGLEIPKTSAYEHQGAKRSFDSIDFGSDFSSFNNDGQGLGGAKSLGARVFGGRRPSPFDLDIFDDNAFFMGRGHPFLPRQTRLIS